MKDKTGSVWSGFTLFAHMLLLKICYGFSNVFIKIVLQTMCFHLGMTEAFIWDHGTENQRITQWPETGKILQEIHEEIVKENRRLIYSHKVRCILRKCALEKTKDKQMMLFLMA